MLVQVLLNGLADGVLMGLLSLGFATLHSGVRFFAFTYGSSVAVAGYTLLLLVPRFGLTVASGAALCTAAGLGALLDAGVYSRLRLHEAPPSVSMMASIGLYVVLENVLSLLFGDATLLIADHQVAFTVEVLGARLSGLRLGSVVVALLAITAVMALLRLTALGRQLRAVADDSALAAALGLPLKWTILAATCIGSALGGVYGCLVALDYGLVPTMGFRALLFAVVASIMGGLGSTRAAVLGGVALGLIHQVLGAYVSAAWRDALVFILLIGCLLAKPHGVFRSRFAAGRTA